MKAIWLIFICTILVFSACEFKDPAGPSWEMRLSVPLVNKPYPISDLIDGENFAAEGDSMMYFYTDGLIEGANVEEGRLKITANEEGSGMFEILNISFVDSLSIENQEATDDVKIVSATVREGRLKFQFRDIHPDLVKVNITFLELITPEEENLSIDIYRSGTDYDFEYDLFEHRFIDTSDGDSTTVLTDLHFNIIQYSNESSLDSFGQMKIYYDENIYFRRIRGLLDDFEVAADDFISDINVDYPTNIENALVINNPKLTFKVYNYIGFDADFFCTVTAYNTRSNITETVHLTRFITAAPSQGDSMLTNLVFTESIERLMNIAPDKIEMTNAYFRVNNPDNRIGFAMEGRAYGGSYRTTVPFNFSFVAGEPVTPKNLIQIDLSENNREEIEKRAKRIKFNVKLDNYFDIGSNVKLIFCSDSSYVYSDIADAPYSYNDGVEDSDNPVFTRITFDGYVPQGSLTQATQRQLTFLLPSEKISIFHRFPTIYFGLVFDFDENDTIVHPDARIEVITSLEADLLIDLDDM